MKVEEEEKDEGMEVDHRKEETREEEKEEEMN